MGRKRHAWQGSADGLCGIYCLLYAIEDCPALGRLENRHQNGLYHLLKSAEEHCNEELASLIAGRNSGFDEDELVTVFNGLPPRFRRGFRAVTLRAYKSAFDGRLEHLRPLLSAGGRAVIDVECGRHWVLAEKMNDDGSVSCRDPSAQKPVTNRKRKSSAEGVALVPKALDSRC